MLLKLLSMKKFFRLVVTIILLSICAAVSTPSQADSQSAQAGNWPNPTVINDTTRNRSASAATVALAKDGKSLMPIVIAADASENIKSIAAELAQYLEKLCGAKFEITIGDGKSGIVLGTIQQFPNAALNKALQIFNDYDGKEAYVIRTRENKVLLLGATELGASHAAMRMLELLGCRWFFQAPEWTDVPLAKSTLSFNTDETDRPQIWSRNIWYAWGMSYFDADDPDPAAAYQSWNRHNLMAQSLGANTGHSWETIVLENKAEFDAHPEYFALVQQPDGTLKRQGPQLEVTNPAVQQMAIKHALDYFKAAPDADMVSIDPADGVGYSVSEESKKLGRPSNQAFYLANIVAKAVREKYPDKLVGLLAYNWHCEPPDFPLEPNVYVQLTTGFTTGMYSYEELLEMWPTKTQHMGYYDYFSTWLWDKDLIPGGRVAGVESYLEPAIKKYASHAATSVAAESGNNWGVNGLGYYIAAKLMWNPNADVDALENDFYQRAFGSAAPAMRRYYEHLSPDSKPMYGKSVVGRAYHDLDEATKQAQGDARVLARLNDLKLYLADNYLHQLIQDAPDKETKKQRTLDWIEHNYRIRNTYMTHWSAVINAGISEGVQAFGDTTWTRNGLDTEPWHNKKPYTQAEINAQFAAGMKYYPTIPDIEEKEFSKDLVPLYPDAVKSPDLAFNSQGAATWAFYNAKGEPLEVRVYHGFVYQTDAPGLYTLKDADGKIVSQGKVEPSHPPQELFDGWVVAKSHVLKLKVPKAGAYFFEFYDAGSGWQIGIKPDTYAVLALQRGQSCSGLSVGVPLIYVPKGTKKIDFYSNTGGEVCFYKPDMTLLGKFPSDGSYNSIPVPDGMDGQLWRAGNANGFALGQLYFFNIPNYLSMTPSAMLIPREVAEADGVFDAQN